MRKERRFGPFIAKKDGRGRCRGSSKKGEEVCHTLRRKGELATVGKKRMRIPLLDFMEGGGKKEKGLFGLKKKKENASAFLVEEKTFHPPLGVGWERELRCFPL